MTVLAFPVCRSAVAVPIGRQQHDLRPPDMLLRGILTGDYRTQLSSVGGAQFVWLLSRIPQTRMAESAGESISSPCCHRWSRAGLGLFTAPYRPAYLCDLQGRGRCSGDTSGSLTGGRRQSGVARLYSTETLRSRRFLDELHA
jgi:hypothetical protein